MMRTTESRSQAPPSMGDFAALLLRRKWLILLVALPVIALSILYSYTRTPVYSASSGVFVRPALTSLTAAFRTTAPDAQTESSLATSEAVATLAKDLMGSSETPQQLLKRVSANMVSGTQFLTISFMDPDPATAQQGARAFSEAYLQFRRTQARERHPGTDAVDQRSARVGAIEGAGDLRAAQDAAARLAGTGRLPVQVRRPERQPTVPRESAGDPVEHHDGSRRGGRPGERAHVAGDAAARVRHRDRDRARTRPGLRRRDDQGAKQRCRSIAGRARGEARDPGGGVHPQGEASERGAEPRRDGRQPQHHRRRLQEVAHVGPRGRRPDQGEDDPGHQRGRRRGQDGDGREPRRRVGRDWATGHRRVRRSPQAGPPAHPPRRTTSWD